MNVSTHTTHTHTLIHIDNGFAQSSYQTLTVVQASVRATDTMPPRTSASPARGKGTAFSQMMQARMQAAKPPHDSSPSFDSGGLQPVPSSSPPSLMGSHSNSPLVLPEIRQLEISASASAGVCRTTTSAVTSAASHPVPTDAPRVMPPRGSLGHAHHGTSPALARSPSGGDREISLLTPPKELLAVVAELQMELRARTDSVNAIQRNFQRLNALYQQDRAEHARVVEELSARANANQVAEGAPNVDTAAMRAQIESLLEEYRSLEESSTLALLASQESLEATELQVIEAKRTQVQLKDELGVLETALSTRTAELHKLEEALADAQRDVAAGVCLLSQTTKNWYHTIIQVVEAVEAALGDDVTQQSAKAKAAPLEVTAAVPDNPIDWTNSELLPKLLGKVQLQTQRLAALRRTAHEQDGHRAIGLAVAESHGRRVLEEAEAMARQWAPLAMQSLTLASRGMAAVQETSSRCDDLWTRLRGQIDMMSRSQAALASSHWEELLTSVEAQLAENFRVASQRATAGETALKVEIRNLHTQMDAERRTHAQEGRTLAARLQQSEGDCANYLKRLKELEAAQQAHEAATALARSLLESSFCEEQNRISAEVSRAKLHPTPDAHSAELAGESGVPGGRGAALPFHRRNVSGDHPSDVLDRAVRRVGTHVAPKSVDRVGLGLAAARGDRWCVPGGLYAEEALRQHVTLSANGGRLWGGGKSTLETRQSHIGSAEF